MSDEVQVYTKVGQDPPFWRDVDLLPGADETAFLVGSASFSLGGDDPVVELDYAPGAARRSWLELDGAVARAEGGLFLQLRPRGSVDTDEPPAEGAGVGVYAFARRDGETVGGLSAASQDGEGDGSETHFAFDAAGTGGVFTPGGEFEVGVGAYATGQTGGASVEVAVAVTRVAPPPTFGEG
jgi:hypothetical protein